MRAGSPEIKSSEWWIETEIFASLPQLHLTELTILNIHEVQWTRYWKSHTNDANVIWHIRALLLMNISSWIWRKIKHFYFTSQHQNKKLSANIESSSDIVLQYFKLAGSLAHYSRIKFPLSSSFPPSLSLFISIRAILIAWKEQRKWKQNDDEYVECSCRYTIQCASGFLWIFSESSDLFKWI